MKIENARIKSTMLGTEDHGIMTAYLHLEGDGWGVGFGGYCFDEYDESANRRFGTAFGTEFILQILRTLDIESWEKLPGTVIRVEYEGWGRKVLRIGHYMKDKWFDPSALAKKMQLEKVSA
jgi:hypothetical protein